jgi:hypothetical protein
MQRYGLTAIVGPPQIGKSWLLMELAYRLARIMREGWRMWHKMLIRCRVLVMSLNPRINRSCTRHG